jgi:hypothetical protein
MSLRARGPGVCPTVSRRFPGRVGRIVPVLLLAGGMALGQAQAPAPARPEPARSPAVQRVFDAFAELRRAGTLPASHPPRTVTVTDADLNAYIRYRISSEKSEVLRDLRLKFLPDDRVEGMMALDLSRVGVPPVLSPKLNFFFSGRLMSQGPRIKFDVDSLFLDYKSVPVFLLELAFYIASKTQKHGPAGIADWYKLPPGIKSVGTEAGRIVFRY